MALKKPQKRSVAVIGAGAAGLVAARELKREGHDVTVFEQGGEVGGVWVYEPETEDDPLGVDPGRKRVFSSMYAGLRTNLPREVMAFSDFPFLPTTMGGLSVDDRTFPGHQEVHSYLRAFTKAFSLGPLVRLHTRVVRVTPPTMLATAAHGPADHGTANGTVNGIPHGTANGAASDCSDTADSSEMGETAGREMTASADGVSSDDNSDGYGGGSGSGGGGSGDGSSVREQWGVTTAPAAGGCEEEHAFDAVLVCNGHFSEPRLPPSPGAERFPGRQMHSHNYREAGPFAGQRVVVVGAAASGEDIGREIALQADQVFLSSRQWDPDSPPAGNRGNILRMPAFCGFDAASPATVQFENGQEAADIDTVVYATGYVYSFPFLNGTTIVKVEGNRVHPLYQHVWAPAYAPGIAFVGIPWKVLPFPQYELQARWAARVLSGRVELPSTEVMQGDVEDWYRQLDARGLDRRFTHRLDGTLQWEYNAWLTEQCGADIPPLAEWRTQLYEEAGSKRKAYTGTYRDLPLDEGVLQQAHQEAAAHAAKTAISVGA